MAFCRLRCGIQLQALGRSCRQKNREAVHRGLKAFDLIILVTTFVEGDEDVDLVACH